MAQGELLALIVEFLTLFTKRLAASSFTAVFGLNIVPGVAFCVVVVNFGFD